MGLAFWLLESFPDLGSSGLVAIQSFEAGGASTEGVHWLMIWDLGAGSEFTVLRICSRKNEGFGFGARRFGILKSVLEPQNSGAWSWVFSPHHQHEITHLHHDTCSTLPQTMLSPLLFACRPNPETLDHSLSLSDKYLLLPPPRNLPCLHFSCTRSNHFMVDFKTSRLVSF